MFALIVTAALVVVVLAELVRELRGGGYGRPAVPSIAETGTDRVTALRVAQSPRG